jgi:hypothetical protein
MVCEAQLLHPASRPTSRLHPFKNPFTAQKLHRQKSQLWLRTRKILTDTDLSCRTIKGQIEIPEHGSGSVENLLLGHAGPFAHLIHGPKTSADELQDLQRLKTSEQVSVL